MICPVCKNEIPDESLICPICRSRAAEGVQEERVAQVRAKISESLGASFVSRPFIAMLISLAAFAASGILYTLFALTKDIGSFIGNGIFYLIPAIYACLSAVGGYKLYKAASADTEDIRALERHPKVFGGYQLAYAIIGGIVGVLLFIAFVMLASLAGTVGDDALVAVNEYLHLFGELGAEEMDAVLGAVSWFLSVGSIVFAVITAIVTAVVVFLSVKCVLAYRKLAAYFVMLADLSLGAKFDKTKVIPKKWLYFFGVLEIITGIFNLTASPLAAVFSLASGAYLISSAVFLTGVYAEQSLLEDEREAAEIALFEIKAQTNAAHQKAAQEYSQSNETDRTALSEE